MKRLELKIQGLVQGIGFRYYSSQEAQKLALIGFVANTLDGSVEIIAEGPEQVLESFLDWCYNGVVSSRVDNIEINWAKVTGEFSNFVIR